MKIVLLSSASSIHTTRWANALASAQMEVHLISLHPLLHQLDERVHLHQLTYKNIFSYFTAHKKIIPLLKEIEPDILNAHYASGYATVARLCNYHPCLTSVWGDDVYDTPKKSLVHKYLIKSNLKFADHIASTSKCMAEHTHEFFEIPISKIDITPFGVDINSFKPIRNKLKSSTPEKFVIGTVKGLEHQYGINVLIEAFYLLHKKLDENQHPLAKSIELQIVGDGSLRAELETLALRLQLSNKVKFLGRIQHEKVPAILNTFDIYAALSTIESFGVAILEASACEIPVVVSNVGGLPEVVEDGKTGYIVPALDPLAASIAFEKLALDSSMRTAFGSNGRQFVVTNYSWKESISIMLKLYNKIIMETRGSTCVG